MQEKESIIFKKGGLEPQKQRFGSTKVKVWHCETSTKVIRVGRYEHPRRSMRMTKVGSMKRKRDEVKMEKKSVKRKKERGKRGKEGCVGMAGMPYPPNTTLLIQCINN